MAKRTVTSEDIAKYVGVSRTTVSFVLNGVHDTRISSTTRQKILDAAVSMGYVPNATAQALANRQTKAIGLVLSRPLHQIATDQFFPQALDGMLEIVQANNLRLLVDVIEPRHQEQAYLELVRATRIDGIIFSGTQMDDIALVNLEKEGFPTVLMGQLPGSNFCSVDIDNRQSARQAVEYLINLGHRQIACITNVPFSYSVSSERLMGYLDALEQAGIPYNEALVRAGDFGPESGYLQMNSLLDSGVPFTAGFVASDTVLLGAYSAIHERGLHIPGDISLVGFDDIASSKYMEPPLTTVHLPAQAIGKQACTMLMQILRGETVPEKKLLLPTELVIRKSCKHLK